MFQVLQARSEPPTPSERALAENRQPMTAALKQQYMEKADEISNNIKDMFEKQAAAAEVRRLSLVEPSNIL